MTTDLLKQEINDNVPFRKMPGESFNEFIIRLQEEKDEKTLQFLKNLDHLQLQRQKKKSS